MRFAFGKNWTSYSKTALNDEKIAAARHSFKNLIGNTEVAGKTFFDIGFGQGLTLCLAAQMGAIATGIDIDEDNLTALRTTANLVGLADSPQVYIGSILDDDLAEQLHSTEQFDIVHSWGVLHHTGNMQKAIDNTVRLVKPDGLLVIAIYNSHWSSPAWKLIKYLYNSSPDLVRKAMIWFFYWIIYIAKFIVTGKNPKQKNRGMDFYHDVVDWVGGYPYEYATRLEITRMLASKEFVEIRFQSPVVPTGCNEYVFKFSGSADSNAE